MQPYAPFSGVLLLPDRAVFGKVSEVTLGTGEPVAAIRWHPWTARARFDILDASGVDVAQGGREGMFGRRYAVHGRDGQALLALKFSLWGLPGRGEVTLPSGRVLTVRGKLWNRTYSVVDGGGLEVARIVSTGRTFSFRPDSFAFELRSPVFSLVQAVGLAQCLRAAVEAQRQASA